jgi:hypothetical protein
MMFDMSIGGGRTHISGGHGVCVSVPASQIRGKKNVGELAPFDLLVPFDFKRDRSKRDDWGRQISHRGTDFRWDFDRLGASYGVSELAEQENAKIAGG